MLSFFPGQSGPYFSGITVRNLARRRGKKVGVDKPLSKLFLRVQLVSSIPSIEGHQRVEKKSVPATQCQSYLSLNSSDGYELPSDGRQKVFSNGTLTIVGASKSTDEGYYTCTAFNRRDESDSGNVHIQVTSETNCFRAS